MLKAAKKITAVIMVVLVLITSFVFGAAAETVTVTDYGFSIQLPDGYTLLNSKNASKNKELIESLGYTVDSFKNYLKAKTDGGYTTLFLGLNPSNGSQISFKVSTTDFSKKIVDMTLLNDEAFAKTAKELVKIPGASYKSVSVKGMKLIEISTSGKDSGGDFCSVQYLTVRNGNLFSIGFSFDGAMDDSKGDIAWKTIGTLDIKNSEVPSAWDAESIVQIIFISIAILAGVVLAIIVVYSLIRDFIRRRRNNEQDKEYITRR